MSSTVVQPIPKSVGVNIGVKPKNSRPHCAAVTESESSLVGPVGIEPTTCGLKGSVVSVNSGGYAVESFRHIAGIRQKYLGVFAVDPLAPLFKDNLYGNYI